MRPGSAPRLKIPVTPSEDQPKTNRAYPLMVREPGPARPTFQGGALGSLKQLDSHSVFGGHQLRSPVKRVNSQETDPRGELA
jgi:hypothetical protein